MKKEKKMIIERPMYLDKVKAFIDKPLVKILVGMRRVGKSYILSQIEGLLLERGVEKSKIIRINFEDFDYVKVRDKDSFIALMEDLTPKGERRYVLLDEVQLVEGWEEVVNGLLAGRDVDIYITGSNSKLLSSEISTVLTGRYVQIPVFTLNFAETLLFKDACGVERKTTAEDFDEYLQKGGFPVLYTANYELGDCDSVVSDIYTSIIYRDLVGRKGIRNIELLERIIKYVFDNIGNVFSAGAVAKYIKNEMRAIDVETVYNYLKWLEEVFVINKVERYDLRRKAILKTQEKYYLGDVGLLYALNGRKESRLPGVLENIVYLELVSRGWKVCIGKNNEKEVDFVAERKGEKMYIQVALHIYDKETFEREYSAFSGIEDNFPKYVLTMDDGWGDNYEGIQKMYLPEFLTNVV